MVRILMHLTLMWHYRRRLDVLPLKSSDLEHPGLPGSEYYPVARMRDVLAVEPPFTLLQTPSGLHAVMEDGDQIPLWLTMQLEVIDGTPSNW